MTQTPPPATLTTTAGYEVLDQGLPGRPPLAKADAYDAALHLLELLQHSVYGQIEANGEGDAGAELALVIAPVDASGAVGPPCYWATVNGMRPASPVNSRRCDYSSSHQRPNGVNRPNEVNGPTSLFGRPAPAGPTRTACGRLPPASCPPECAGPPLPEQGAQDPSQTLRGKHLRLASLLAEPLRPLRAALRRRSEPTALRPGDTGLLFCWRP